MTYYDVSREKLLDGHQPVQSLLHGAVGDSKPTLADHVIDLVFVAIQQRPLGQAIVQRAGQINSAFWTMRSSIPYVVAMALNTTHKLVDPDSGVIPELAHNYFKF